MILISLIRVNLIKEGTAEKTKSRKAGGQGSAGRPRREAFAAREPSAAGHSGAEPLHLFGHGLGLNPRPPRPPGLTPPLPRT